MPRPPYLCLGRVFVPFRATELCHASNDVRVNRRRASINDNDSPEAA